MLPWPHLYSKSIQVILPNEVIDNFETSPKLFSSGKKDIYVFDSFFMPARKVTIQGYNGFNGKITQVNKDIY